MNKSLTFIFLIYSIIANANVRMPLLFSDGMVLQRNKEIPVWGWADVNEKVEVRFNNQTQSVQADRNGKWILKLNAEQAGGPFELIITGKNKIVIKNVLVGEVWICSGQSNMEFEVGNVIHADQEVNDSDYPMIRHFGVVRDFSGLPKKELKAGEWLVTNKQNIQHFTAVGFFFAKKIYAELKIPVGIINSSWGGTNIETWMSREAFEKDDEFKEMIVEVPIVNTDSISRVHLKSMAEKVEKIQGEAVNDLNEISFKDSAFKDLPWKELNAPETWETQSLGDLDGVVWMRKTIDLSAEDIKNPGILRIAKIDDEDITYINGIEIGRNTQWDVERIYNVPKNILVKGKNVIAIRIVDNGGGGGIYGNSSDLKLTLGNKNIPLAGKWKYKVIAIKTDLSPNSYPSLLYNAMINPLIPYAFQGVLWCQGETNVWRANQYKKAFPLLINNWRTKWKQGNFPFYFVQLSTFNEFNGNSKIGSRWAELREAQSETLRIPNTGMAVTTDIGNANDIHPTNKQEVGLRLAAIALNNTYGKKRVFSGPTYISQQIKGNEIVISFGNLGSGLSTLDTTKNVKGFEIAGPDKIFHSANAIIKNNTVIVSSANVFNPVAVRYGWADDDTTINLYNREKFPASPFRTDDWEMITVNEKYKISK